MQKRMITVQVECPPDMGLELASEAKRQDRTPSWLLQIAWRIARDRIRDAPCIDDQVRRALWRVAPIQCAACGRRVRLEGGKAPEGWKRYSEVHYACPSCLEKRA